MVMTPPPTERRVDRAGIGRETSDLRRAHEQPRRHRGEIGKRTRRQAASRASRRSAPEQPLRSERRGDRSLRPARAAGPWRRIRSRSLDEVAVGRPVAISKPTLPPGPQRRPRAARMGATRSSAARAGAASVRVCSMAVTRIDQVFGRSPLGNLDDREPCPQTARVVPCRERPLAARPSRTWPRRTTTQGAGAAPHRPRPAAARPSAARSAPVNRRRSWVGADRPGIRRSIVSPASSGLRSMRRDALARRHCPAGSSDHQEPCGCRRPLRRSGP